MTAAPMLARSTSYPRPAAPTITDAGDARAAGAAIAQGAVLAHGFANFYVITTRADAATVRAVNLMKGRPPGQVGSITGPPEALAGVWDLDRLPEGLTPTMVRRVVDAFFALGPFGFRGPAADHVADHLTAPDQGIRTAQVIAPGHACPSNDLLRAALRATGDDVLYITSANRSRHLTGADDSPAHWQSDGLRAEFGEQPGFVVVEHADEARARAAYPSYRPMSTTIIGFHALGEPTPGDPRPHLLLERHGSLHVQHVRRVLAGLGLGLTIRPTAQRRLLMRDYSKGLSDR